MMGRLDSVGTWFAMHGHERTASAFISKADEIMSKYRPIAPKPTLPMASNSLCKSTSNPNSALDCSSTFTTTSKAIDIAKSGHGGHCRSRHRRRASDCSKSPLPRVLKRARAPTDGSSPHSIVGTSVIVDGSKLVCPFDRSEKLTVEKDSVFMKKAAATEESVTHKGSAGFEWVKTKEAMNSIDGEVGGENPPTNMEVVAVPSISETQNGCGFAKYFVFPIVSDIQQQLQQVENNLVTLPLLPQTPSLQHDSILDSLFSGSTSTYHNPNRLNGSCDKEETRLRVFGRDFSHKEVGGSQISTDETLKPTNFVPIVGLSFL